MRLNLHILADWLASHRFEGRPLDGWQTRACVRSQVLKLPLAEYVEGPVYLTRAENLPASARLTGHPTLLVIGRPSSWWESAACNLLWTPEDADETQLANELSEQFSRYQLWDEALRDAADAGAAPVEFARCCEGIFDNPIILMGPRMQVICQYMPKVEPDPPQYRALRERYGLRTGATEFSDFVVDHANTPDYFDIGEAREPFVVSMPGGYEAMYHTLYRDGVPVASVVMEAIVKPLSDRDRALTTIWGQRLLPSLATHMSYSLTHSHRSELVLRGLFEHRMQTDEGISRLLGEHGWEDHDTYVCVAAEPPESLDSTALEHIALSATRGIGSCCHRITEGRLALVFNLTQLDMESGEQLRKRLSRLFASRGYRFSFSLPFHRFRNLWYYWKQATRCEELGRLHEPRRFAHFYQDLELEDILARCKDQTLAETYVPDGLWRLRARDLEHGSAYVETLRVYLDCERNITESSKRLFVHRNTFLYRMERIEKVLGMDLDDPDIRIVLHIALRLLDSTLG